MYGKRKTLEFIKESILKLEPNGEFEAEYSVEFFEV